MGVYIYIYIYIFDEKLCIKPPTAWADPQHGQQRRGSSAPVPHSSEGVEHDLKAHSNPNSSVTL